MFYPKKLITYFVLLPPGNVVLFLTLLGMFLLIKKHKRVAKLTLLAAVVLYLISTEVVATLLITPLEGRYHPPPREVRDKCEVIAVLGGGIKIGAPFLDTKNDLNEDAFKRVVGAYKLYTEKPRPIAVSGYSVSDSHSEAAVMKEVLVYLGVKPSDIITEGKSRDTYENALFLREKLGGNKTLCLVTSAYHMERALYLFTLAGFERKNIVPVPVDYKASHSPFTWYKLLPTPYWLNISAKALREYFGLLYYYLREVAHKWKRKGD